ncbi:DUF58 domain-containing protein [Roseibacillus ishigakijimensis]|uniref:DUF58 domain-containing protein n=1 Tax=Roseibacillus ishigakijimensis TaxID=454146 RepID=UPI0019062886|nr:DUF58 domain-containing protein [Roseibacillus ishigakijimensis]
MKEARLRFLHRNYSRTGRWGWRMSRRIRPFGWGILLLTILAAVLGANIENSAVYMMFTLGVSSMGLALLWLAFRQGKISGHRHLPEFASVGEELHYTVTIKNEHRRKLVVMLFEEWPPDPSPDYKTFATTPEPGEEKRNLVDRFLLYYRWTWLQERERGFSLIEARQSPRQLASGEVGHLHFTLIPQHRGLLKIEDLRLLLPDPMGLFQRSLPTRIPPEHIVVLPKRYPITNLHLLGAAHHHLGGDSASNRSGDNGDFLHLRDYQNGDAMRSVDWKSWARTGQPVVREYEDNYYPHYGIILDTNAPLHQAFEEAVSIASSFVVSMNTQECLLDLLFLGDQSYRLTAGQGVARRAKLLEALATVTSNQQDNFKDLEALIKKESSHLTALIAIFPDWSPSRQLLVQSLQARGMVIHSLIVGDDQVSATFEQFPVPQAHLLSLSQIPADLARATQKFAP